MIARGKRGQEHRAADPEQHHAVPLLINAGLLLLGRDILQLLQLVHPGKVPVDVTMFVHLEVLGQRGDRRGREAHALRRWRNHRECSGIKSADDLIRQI